MKVGILTYHRADNHGAVLQAYALQKYVYEKGVDCEIIDYCNPVIENLRKNNSYKDLIKSMVSGKRIKATRRKFDDFRARLLNTSRYVYNRESIGRSNDLYDCFISGSDQVWNYRGNGFDKTYFLDFVKNIYKRNSYAASFGFEEIPQNYKQEYTKLLSNYNQISVREQQGYKIINSLLNKGVNVNIDPTLLLDKKKWKTLIGQPLVKERYIIIYSFGMTDEMYQTACRISAEKKLKPIMLTNSIRPYKKLIKAIGIGPFEFLNLFYYSELVLTNSFHGLAFAINFNKEFYVETTSELNKSVKSRICDLLELLQISERIIQNSTQLSEINYCNVNKLLEIERKKSDEYLNNLFKDPKLK